MKIEKICEYFNDIGLLQIGNISRFLKIYSQLSHNKCKNKSDKLILALFSYITLISKNEQQLYDICKNMVHCLTNNQIINRYKSLNILNNIFKTKLHSKYILFFCKLNSYIFNKKRSIKNTHLYKNQNIYNYPSNVSDDNYENEKEYVNNTSIGKNIKNFRPIKGRIINKKRMANKNINKKNYELSDDEKECTFSPKINQYSRPYYKSNTDNNMKNNLNSNNNSFLINENMEDNSSKFIPFKNSINYGYNNNINNEIEKMLINMSKYTYTPNNTRYIPKKTIYRKQINDIYPSTSYRDMSYNDESNDNNIYHYYDEDYDFYQNENNHIRKVQDKILGLQLQKIDKQSKECTFSPEINKTPKYLYKNNNNNNNYLIDNNLSYRNYFNNYNEYKNKTVDNKKTTKNNKINDEYADDYYNIFPKKLNKKKRARSFSGTKNEFSIYKKREEDLKKLMKEKYPFMPNIKYDKNIIIKNTFEERQKQLIDNKKDFYNKKKEEELEEIKKFQISNKHSKKDIKDIVDHLYDSKKIKEKVMNEKKAKSKKKKYYKLGEKI